MDLRLPTTDAPSGPNGGPHAAWRVLVVDDDADFHPFLEMLFQLDGRFSMVGHARTGEAARELARSHRPDAIVLDLSTPGTDGCDVLPDLRRLVPDAAIVVFSAFPEVITLLHALAAGADDYLNKASAWELVPVMAQLLAGRGQPGHRPAGTTGWDGSGPA